MFISFLLFFLLRSYFLMQKNAHRIALKLTQQLHEEEKKLALANADLVQFTNISAHHLQEPTRRIISFIQRLKKELASVITLNEDATFSLNFIEQSAFRQRALVRDIQLYLAATQPRSVVESVDVVSVIHKVLADNAPLISKMNARIEYGKLPAVTIDRPRLYDIFNVLLTNAISYSRPNCPPKIRIYTDPTTGNRIRYYVEDNGIGIPLEYRERVFLVFERLQVTENQDSTGIGLAIVRRILQSCNGSVSLQETPGGGTTVIFDLPAETESTQS
jgi:light-regulated signal transduction histidine kinase (bacteriophytochrome)